VLEPRPESGQVISGVVVLRRVVLPGAEQRAVVDEQLLAVPLLQPLVEGGAPAGLAGGRGIGRRTCRASSAGSRASATSDDTDSLAGIGTWVAPSPRRCARSASSRPASRSQASVSS
jgi:hypothetical protein